jgi:hypothetical protein
VRGWTSARKAAALAHIYSHPGGVLTFRRVFVAHLDWSTPPKLILEPNPIPKLGKAETKFMVFVTNITVLTPAPA